MTGDNHACNRGIQQDAREWARFTHGKYTAALRQMQESPLTCGLLGERVSARQLIAALDEHELIGARGGEARLGANGYADTEWHFNGETDFVQLALVTEFLRMFTPTLGSVPPEVSSYSLKHSAEKFLAPHLHYVSNGQLIWAAAALGLPLLRPESGGLNVLVGVSEAEHDYVRRMVNAGNEQPRAHHHRPAGYEPLRTALDRHAAGEPVGARWVPAPAQVVEAAPFHDWLSLQTERTDTVGVLATDYLAGLRDHDHQVARTPDDLVLIFYGIDHSGEAYDAVVTAIGEWMAVSPVAKPIRTPKIDAESYEHSGWGAGAGTVERYEYRCPCGGGAIVEEHDNTPGFREHDVSINCGKCHAEWVFATGRSIREWGLEPAAWPAGADEWPSEASLIDEQLADTFLQDRVLLYPARPQRQSRSDVYLDVDLPPQVNDVEIIGLRPDVSTRDFQQVDKLDSTQMLVVEADCDLELRALVRNTDLAVIGRHAVLDPNVDEGWTQVQLTYRVAAQFEARIDGEYCELEFARAEVQR